MVHKKYWRKLRANRNLRTLKKWYSGEASARRIQINSGRHCAEGWRRRRSWRSTKLKKPRRAHTKNVVSRKNGESSRTKRGVSLQKMEE